MKKGINILVAASCTMISGAAFAQSDKQLTNFEDTTMMLQEVTVKCTLPKTRVKGDAMRTIVTGSILEKAGKVTNNLDLNYRKGGLDITASFWCGDDHTHRRASYGNPPPSRSTSSMPTTMAR